MYADGKASEWRGSAAFFRYDKVAERAHVSFLLAKHRDADCLILSCFIIVTTVAAYNYMVIFSICREEFCCEHYLEVSKSDLFFGVSSQLHKFHRFHLAASIFHSPDCIEHFPIEIWQDFF